MNPTSFSLTDNKLLPVLETTCAVPLKNLTKVISVKKTISNNPTNFLLHV